MSDLFTEMRAELREINNKKIKQHTVVAGAESALSPRPKETNTEAILYATSAQEAGGLHHLHRNVQPLLPSPGPEIETLTCPSSLPSNLLLVPPCC